MGAHGSVVQARALAGPQPHARPTPNPSLHSLYPKPHDVTHTPVMSPGVQSL